MRARSSHRPSDTDTASATTRQLRAQLASLLESGDAHVTFDRAVSRLPPRARGVAPAGMPHSIWHVVEHIRIAQADILEFCRSSAYKTKKWPDDYWPASPTPKSPAAWRASLAAYRRDRRALQRMAKDDRIDLFAKIPHGTGQTYLRELLIVADHTAYHVGEIVLLRRALAVW